MRAGAARADLRRADHRAQRLHRRASTACVSGRRGQILGFDAKEGWQGWDEVNAYLPQSELHDLIIELRSLTLGVGTFSWKFDHLQELTGRARRQDRRAAAAATAH